MSFTEFVLAGAAFLFGSASGVGAGIVFLFLWVEKERKAGPLPEKISLEPETDLDSFRLARQYENMMNYDGTERGQMSLEK